MAVAVSIRTKVSKENCSFMSVNIPVPVPSFPWHKLFSVLLKRWNLKCTLNKVLDAAAT